MAAAPMLLGSLPVKERRGVAWQPLRDQTAAQHARIEDDPDNAEIAAPSSGGEGKRHVAGPSIAASFLLTGTGCGWFVMDALGQLLTNSPEVQQHGRMLGTFTLMGGSFALVTAGLGLADLLASPCRVSLAGQQMAVSMNCALTVLTLAFLTVFWDTGAPAYPVVQAGAALGNLVATFTSFCLFPMVSTHYGGWLVAYVRAGSDASLLITSLLGEAQNPTGNHNLFAPWILFLVYTGIASFGLVAWACIVRFGIGLQACSMADVEDSCSAEGQREEQGAEVVERAGRKHLTAWEWPGHKFRSLELPKALLLPLSFAVLVEVAQWGLVGSFGYVAAGMTDPSGCDGPTGHTVYRTAQTLNRVALPLASLASSIAKCPTWLFNCLAMAQLVATGAISAIVAGVARDFWTTPAGQSCYIALFALVGGLEGYVLTMVYRYIGDDEGMSLKQTDSASKLLSFLSVIFVCPICIVVGILVDRGAIACTAL